MSDLLAEYFPGGDPDRLRAASAAWTALAEEWDQVPIDVKERDMVAELLGFFPPEKLHSTYYRRIRDRDATLASLNVVGRP